MHVCVAVGCTNMIPPENAWLRRSDNDIIIGCYSSQQTWQLKCDGREWKGLVGTCPELCKRCRYIWRHYSSLCEVKVFSLFISRRNTSVGQK